MVKCKVAEAAQHKVTAAAALFALFVVPAFPQRDGCLFCPLPAPVCAAAATSGTPATAARACAPSLVFQLFQGFPELARRAHLPALHNGAAVRWHAFDALSVRCVRVACAACLLRGHGPLDGRRTFCLLSLGAKHTLCCVRLLVHWSAGIQTSGAVAFTELWQAVTEHWLLGRPRTGRHVTVKLGLCCRRTFCNLHWLILGNWL